MTSRRGKSRPPASARRARAAHVAPVPQPALPDEAEHVARDPLGNLLISGWVNGPIVHELDVTIGPAGHVVGAIRARAIVVEGQVAGDLHATATIRVAATGRVHGDLHAAQLGVAAGAQLCGRFVMPERSAPSLELNASGVDRLLGG